MHPIAEWIFPGKDYPAGVVSPSLPATRHGPGLPPRCWFWHLVLRCKAVVDAGLRGHGTRPVDWPGYTHSNTTSRGREGGYSSRVTGREGVAASMATTVHVTAHPQRVAVCAPRCRGTGPSQSAGPRGTGSCPRRRAPISPHRPRRSRRTCPGRAGHSPGALIDVDPWPSFSFTDSASPRPTHGTHTNE